jgi:anti-sigma factor RsiW
MNNSVIQLNGPAHHDAVQRLLPWYLNQTLSAVERVRVDKHLAECALCRIDLAEQQEMVALIGPESSSDSADRGIAALNRLLDEEVATAAPARREGGSTASGWGPPWMRVALVAQMAGIVGLGVLAFPRLESTAPYVTLGSTGAPREAGDQVIIAFRDEATNAGIRRILDPIAGRMVDGPTATGAFVIVVPAGTASNAVATLRKVSDVRLAESLVLGHTP